MIFTLINDRLGVFLYNIGVFLYKILLQFAASLGNVKAQKWIDGRKDEFLFWQTLPVTDKTRVWFHVASLGEFEQARPVLEALKQQQPDIEIVLTFFSPSGYEAQKKYPLAAYVAYLPIDTATNAAKLIAFIQPKMVFFTKYDFWYHYFNETHKQGIPLYVISAIFRKEQIFFRWYGLFFRKLLRKVTHFFVQNEASLQLLKSIAIHNLSVSGDTRFDRVLQIQQATQAITDIAPFFDGRPVVVAGSTWPVDDKLVLSLLANASIQLVIVPHEIHATYLKELKSTIPAKAVLLSEGITAAADVLIVDRIGLLSKIYQYATVAYIGGGFGKGIHNTLEAAVWGVPLVFGPNYSRFAEACGLISCEAAFSVKNKADFIQKTTTLLGNETTRVMAAKSAHNYVLAHSGATAAIIKQIL